MFEPSLSVSQHQPSLALHSHGLIPSACTPSTTMGTISSALLIALHRICLLLSPVTRRIGEIRLRMTTRQLTKNLCHAHQWPMPMTQVCACDPCCRIFHHHHPRDAPSDHINANRHHCITPCIGYSHAFNLVLHFCYSFGRAHLVHRGESVDVLKIRQSTILE